jgi:hypothetical protein
LKSFVDDPHAAIEGMGQGKIINLADHRAEKSRRAQLDLLSSLGPDKIAAEFERLECREDVPTQSDQFLLPHLIMPSHPVSGRATSSPAASMAIWLPPPIAGQRTFLNYS